MAESPMKRTYHALIVSVVSLFMLFLAIDCQPCLAYTPKDPVVTRMVARGLAYIENESDPRPGAMAVMALALVKAGKPTDHPLIVKTVEMIQQTIVKSGGDPSKLEMGTEGGNNDIYSIGTSAIFLLSLDSATYRREIEFLLESLYSRQKDHGGWGYEDRDSGDTSMTQYAVLSFWEANQEGFRIPARVLEGVATWLLRTQDPSGAFAYQGTVSPTFQPVPQISGEIRVSMVAAGLGSLYICSDLMGFGKAQKRKEVSALEEVAAEDQDDSSGSAAAKINTSLDASLVRRAQERGNQWMSANFEIDAANVPFKHYYLYALERYCSFRELDEGKGDGKDGPGWYNAGVDYLRNTQKEDGSWHSAVNKPVDTSFAVLFLLRSMQKSIQRKRGFGPGTLVGGRGFPKDGEVVIRDGQAVAKPLLGPFEAMRAAMDKNDEADLAEAVGRIDEMGPKESEVLMSQYAQKLRELASDPSPDNRIAAVRVLGKSGNIENAPLLILALEDEDAEVVLEARDALRRLSRQIGGFGPPDEFTPAECDQAIKNWRAWYKELHPDAEF